MIQKSMTILKKLQHPTGVFSAAPNQKTGYFRTWIRDTVYQAFGFEKHEPKRAIKAYQALLDIFIKHEYKIDWAIIEKPNARFKYIHARYDPHTLEEIWEEWGNKQNDAVGAFLFAVGRLEKKGLKVLRDVNDYRVMQKLVFYLKTIEYWKDEDNGIWEENEEVHASSVGACVAGLKMVKDLLYVPEKLIEEGERKLNELLPRESITKEVDLALLSLIWPYNIVNERQAKEILENVEKKLVREKGVIRYTGDKYYQKNGKEAEWVFGFPWLALIYKQLKDDAKYNFYIEKSHSVINEKGEMPELYFGGTSVHNENSPLGWAQAMYILSIAS